MRATFVGHQGWLITSGRTRILIDPLLTSGFGHGRAVGAVYPPRRVDLDAWPPIDALVLTHEHEDHFDVPSLCRIDRRVPVLLSARSSRAADGLLRELGFEVQRFAPLEPIRVGVLELIALWSDVRSTTHDEWDVLPFIVRDGVDAFYTTIDVELPKSALRELARLVSRPLVMASANNMMSFVFQNGAEPGTTAETDVAMSLMAQVNELRAAGVDVAALLICGGGLSFEGDRAWMNRHAFPASSRAVASTLAMQLPDVEVRAPLPGESVVIEQGAILPVEEAPDALVVVEPDAVWPDRTYLPPIVLHESYAPATRRSMSTADWQVLTGELAELATSLYGGSLFRALLSLSPSELGGRVARIALVLLEGDDDDARLFAYDPTSASFEPAESDDPVGEYVAGFECWAADLLAFMRVELSPTAMFFGRIRHWSHAGASVDPEPILWAYRHPLHNPDRWLRFYRSLCAAPPIHAACIRARVEDAD